MSIYAKFEIDTNHPIFLDQPITIYAEGEMNLGRIEPWEDPKMQDCNKILEYWEIVSIDGKQYSEKIISSVTSFLKKNYLKLIQDKFELLAF